MVVYPAQTIFLYIVGCKLLQLMRKGFTWKLECISSQVANEAVGSIRTLALFCAEVKVIKGYRGIAFLDYFFILFASYTDSLYAGARIMEKQHSNMIFKLHHVRNTTNIHTSVFTVIDRESKIDPSDASGRMLDNVKGDIEHCHTFIVNTFQIVRGKPNTSGVIFAKTNEFQTDDLEDANKYVALSDAGSSLLD
ncbi:hypothetical protein YC2023_083050 [Brassica napus]